MLVRLRLLVVLGALVAAEGAVASGPALERIAFGSCAKQTQPQPVWDAVVARDPDLFILAGDNVYADTTRKSGFRRAYDRLARKPGFQRLRQRTPLMATWDDHDYGANDGGATYPAKPLSERIFLDFFGVAADDPRRRRPGIYTAETFGPPGKRVQIVLLDTRYFRSAVPTRDGRYGERLDAAATMLGRRQWRWLDRVLARPADLRLVVSSTQVLPDPPEAESWSHMPHERRRLLDRLERAGHTVLLSGDRHFGEILRMGPYQAGGVGYPLYEVTASGLNSAGKHWHRANAYRFGWGPYPEDHFGEIGIDWGQRRVILRIVSAEGKVMRRKPVDLETLATPGD